MFNIFSFWKGKKPVLKPVKVVLAQKPVFKAKLKKGVKAKAKKPIGFKSIKAIKPPVSVKRVNGIRKPLIARKPMGHANFIPQPKPIIKAPVAQAPIKPIKKVLVQKVQHAAIPHPNENVTVPIIYPYKAGSEAAKLLATELKTKRVLENGNYSYRPNHLIINYGNKRVPTWSNGVKVNVLNHWNAIQASSNKLSALQRFRDAGVQTVEFTTDKKQAIAWVNKGAVIMCRTVLNGYGGSGIVVASEAKQIVDAPLYCVYKKSKGEYRVIVVNGAVVDFMQKKRKLDFEEQSGEKVNGMIRNHNNGWIFARNEVQPPKNVLTEAVKAVEALGLNFAGVDVIYNQKENKAYVLECNTAIGLQPEGTTLKRLAKAFAEVCKDGKVKPLV